MAGMLLGSKGLRSYGRYGSVGLELLLSIAVGYYFGHWVDGKLGTSWIALVGFLLGCYAGFRSLFRNAKKMQRDIERDERLERGEDPWHDPDVTAPAPKGPSAPVAGPADDDAKEPPATKGGYL